MWLTSRGSNQEPQNRKQRQTQPHLQLGGHAATHTASGAGTAGAAVVTATADAAAAAAAAAGASGVGPSARCGCEAWQAKRLRDREGVAAGTSPAAILLGCAWGSAENRAASKASAAFRFRLFGVEQPAAAAAAAARPAVPSDIATAPDDTATRSAPSFDTTAAVAKHARCAAAGKTAAGWAAAAPLAPKARLWGRLRPGAVAPGRQ